MNLEQFAHDNGHMVRQYEYDDGRIVAVDFGSAAGDASVDLVEDTVIIVFGDEQYEFELPLETDAQAFIRNGVLTIEMEAHQ